MKPTLNRFFAVFATLVACWVAQPVQAASEGMLMPSARTALPDIGYKDAEGAFVPLSAHKGKVVLLHFWAKWCPPCIDELPKMVAMLDSLDAAQREELVIVPLSLDRDSETVRAFFEQNGLSLPIMRDEGSKAMRALEIRGLPSTVLINRSGEEVARREGVVDWGSTAVHGLIVEEIATHP
jgi:thiol-disulfide isomerase/thioredoxin